MTVDTITSTLIAIVVVLFIALIFSKQIHAVAYYLLTRSVSRTEVKILRRKTFVDVNTLETFDRWSQVNGLRRTFASIVINFL